MSVDKIHIIQAEIDHDLYTRYEAWLTSQGIHVGGVKSHKKQVTSLLLREAIKDLLNGNIELVRKKKESELCQKY